MAKKKSNNPYLLFAISTCLLSAGWLMKSFPLLIFTGFTPLFGITDHVDSKKSFWNFFELILIALSVSLFAAYVFNTKYLVPILVQGIIFTCAFVGYSYARRNVGDWLGKFCIVIFWLGAEYLLLKLSWPNPTLFLADALLLKTDWLRWTYYTGYLGTTAWILVCNLVLYYALLKNEKLNLVLIGAFIVLLAGPIIYSYTIDLEAIKRDDMIGLYESPAHVEARYSAWSEYIPRTAALVSGLILIFALVKEKTQAK